MTIGESIKKLEDTIEHLVAKLSTSEMLRETMLTAEDSCWKMNAKLESDIIELIGREPYVDLSFDVKQLEAENAVLLKRVEELESIEDILDDAEDYIAHIQTKDRDVFELQKEVARLESLDGFNQEHIEDLEGLLRGDR